MFSQLTKFGLLFVAQLVFGLNSFFTSPWQFLDHISYLKISYVII